MGPIGLPAQEPGGDSGASEESSDEPTSDADEDPLAGPGARNN